MTQCYRNYIHGNFIDNASGETFRVINPATGEVAYEVQVADEAVQQAAIESAGKGFAEWSR